MADTSFVDNVLTSANRIVAAWLNAVNNQVYQGTNPVFATTTGAAGAYVLTLPGTSLLSALAAGQRFVFLANHANSGAATLQIVGASTLTAKAITIAGTALVGGEIVSGGVYVVDYNATSDRFELTPRWAISVFTQTLLDDATAAAARSTLGLGGTLGIPAQGRLSLTSGSPITDEGIGAQTTTYFVPFNGNSFRYYDGSAWQETSFTELSQAKTDATKSPAATAADSNYDMFVWNDSGTPRCTRGPLWTSATARGTGAGTTELELFEGVYVNKVAITNGPAARQGTYVGTVRTTGAASFIDEPTNRYVWNLFNRVARHMLATDGTDSWTYTTATWRQANGAAANKVEFVLGLSLDLVSGRVCANFSNSAAGTQVGVGCYPDGTTSGVAAYSHNAVGTSNVAGQRLPLVATYQAMPGIGYHFLSWNEYSQAAGTTTWYGDNGGLIMQSGLQAMVLG